MTKIDIRNGVNEMQMDKKELEGSNLYYKKALEDQLQDIKARTGNWVKKTLIIGGSLWVSYKIAKLIIAPDHDDKKDNDERKLSDNAAPVVIHREPSIGRVVKESIALFLVGLAKQKIKDFLETLENGDEIRDIQEPEARKEDRK